MMSKSKGAKNQHYVPQFLLRNFATGKNLAIHVFDKLNETSFTTSPRNVASETGFYDFEHDGKQRSLDPLMTRMETSVSRVIMSIVRKETIAHVSKDDRVALSLFAAVQLLRVKSMRHRLKSINTGLRAEMARRGIDPGDFVPELDEHDIKNASLSHIANAKKIAKYFYEKAWILQRAPNGTSLYVSDNPITLHNLVQQPGRGNLGLKSPGVEIYLPISRQLAICFLCRSMCDAIQGGLNSAAEFTRRFGSFPVDITPLRRIADCIATGDPDPLLPENVIHQNSLQVLFSSRFVFCATGDFELVKSMINENPQLKYPAEMVVE